MVEIKSSIEIAMEKTKNLLLSSEEKEKLYQEEILNKARGIVNRYQEGKLSLRDVEDEFKSHPEETKDLFLHQISKMMIENIKITQDNQRIFEAITFLKKGKTDPKIMDKATGLVEEYQKAVKEGLLSIESLLRKKLASLGIQGDAIIPNTEGSTEWQEFKRETARKYESELNRLKEKL